MNTEVYNDFGSNYVGAFLSAWRKEKKQFSTLNVMFYFFKTW
jgi:hypothetical protein